MISGYFPSNPRSYLHEELEQRKIRRPHYSMRAFARDLEISPSFLCEFLAGRQGMSRERVHWVGKRIKLSEEQVKHFWDLVEEEFGRSEKDRKAAKLRSSLRTQNDESRLSVEKFHFISEWYHLALLELLDLPKKQFSDEEMAKILDIPVENVQVALDRLINLNLIEKTDSYYKVLTENTVTGDEGMNRAIQLYHQQFLKMHSDKVEEKSIEERESLSLSFAISDEDWEKMQNEIKQSIISIVSRYASTKTNKDQVVCLAMQAIKLLGSKESKRD